MKKEMVCMVYFTCYVLCLCLKFIIYKSNGYIGMLKKKEKKKIHRLCFENNKVE